MSITSGTPRASLGCRCADTHDQYTVYLGGRLKDTTGLIPATPLYSEKTKLRFDMYYTVRLSCNRVSQQRSLRCTR